MFLISINGVSDIDVLKALYVSVRKYHLEKVAYFRYIVDILNKGYKTKHLIVDSFHLNINDICHIDNGEIEDFMYDMIEKNIPITIDSKNAKEDTLNLFQNIAIETGLPYVDLHNYLDNKNSTLRELTDNDVSLVHDWLDIKLKNKQKYDHNSFLVRVTVEDNGEMYNEGKLIGNIMTDNLIDILFTKCSVRHTEPVIKNDSFGYFMYEPWAFIGESVDFENILTYKANLFDMIKNIEPESYEDCPEELWNAFNENSYIKMDDIMSIIKREDEIINKYY